MATISGIFLAPPISIARLGASPTPLENFSWAEDPRAFGAGQTVIQPQASIEVSANGAQSVYVPSQIRFRDAGMIRPACPFLELWGILDGKLQPLTIDLLNELGAGLANVSYEVVAANRKAARRTGDENCAFSASLRVSAADFVQRPLLASSPNAGGEPLVFEHAPIPLGAFQPLRPLRTRADGTHIRYGVDLRRIRVRFTPAKGEVYGPPSTTSADDPDSGRRHEIVPAANRITNSRASWNFHDQDRSNANDAPPQPTYDGESDLARKGLSFGVVDDTCEALVRARLAWNGQTFDASARIFTGPPDYAPDRRPFYSLSDEFADRDRSSHGSGASDVELQNYVFDLFRRVHETSSLINVDRQRLRLLAGTSSEQTPGLPKTNLYSMRKHAGDADTADDRKFLSAEGSARMEDPLNGDQHPEFNTDLARAELARDRHEVLADAESLIDEIIMNADLIPNVIRPPYKAFSAIPAQPGGPAELNEARDPRVARDCAHDMRMPPYMRDSDATALSLTARQYELLMKFIREARSNPEKARPAATHRDQYLKRRNKSRVDAE